MRNPNSAISMANRRRAVPAALSEAGVERSKSARAFAAHYAVPWARFGGALGGMPPSSSMVACHIAYLVRHQAAAHSAKPPDPSVVHRELSEVGPRWDACVSSLWPPGYYIRTAVLRLRLCAESSDKILLRRGADR